MTYTAKELERLIIADGWYFVRQVGSHRQFRHAQKHGVVTIPNHKGDLPIGTAKSILRQAGLSSGGSVRR